LQGAAHRANPYRGDEGGPDGGGITMKLPALDPQPVPVVRGSGYPEPFKSRMGDRAKRRLGDACGLTKLGVNLVTLGPGGQSALRLIRRASATRTTSSTARRGRHNTWKSATASMATRRSIPTTT